METPEDTWARLLDTYAETGEVDFVLAGNDDVLHLLDVLKVGVKHVSELFEYL